MKLGLWGARMDNSGLGYQTQAFFKYMLPIKTLVVDISGLERLPERVMKQYPERFTGPNVSFVKGFPTHGDMEEFLQGLDVVFIAESAYNNDFYRLAKSKGVKVANQYNFEFFDWIAYPQFETPDLFIAPSTWNYDRVTEFCKEKGAKHVYLHAPVDRDVIRYRHIDSVTSFVHIAGRPATHDRNGTRTFLEAVTLDRDLNLPAIVYTQDKALADEIRADYPRVRVKESVNNYTDLYKKGSVLVMPRKYGGNCLPMNEALAAGMPVIMSDLSPQNDFLPKHWLVPAKETNIEFVPRVKVPVYECSPYELYLKMRWFKSLSYKDMIKQNLHADKLADTISWKTMAPKYQEVLEALCQL